MRAENLSFRKGTFYGSGAPFASEASGMATLSHERLEAALRASQNSIEFMSNLSKF